MRIGSSLVSGLAENIPQAVLRLPNARRTPGASIIYVEADSVADGFTVKKSSQQRLFVLGKLHSLQARDSTSSADADIFPSHQHDDRPRFRTLLLCLPRLPLDLWTEPPQCGLADHTWSRCRAAVVPPVLPTQNARGESADHSLKSRC